MYLSERITFERDGVVYCLRFVPLAYQEYVTHVTARSVLYTISYPATSAELAAAGYMRVPSVEELARALYSVEDVAATTYGVDLMPWERRSEETRTEYRETARAVLRALGVMGDADD